MAGERETGDQFFGAVVEAGEAAELPGAVAVDVDRAWSLRLIGGSLSRIFWCRRAVGGIAAFGMLFGHDVVVVAFLGAGLLTEGAFEEVFFYVVDVHVFAAEWSAYQAWVGEGAALVVIVACFAVAGC